MKFHYLRSSLQGEAKVLLETLPVTDITYDIVWKLLCKRYNNKRLIANEHILTLCSPPKYQSESATSLHTIIDHFKGHISAIKSLNTEVPLEDVVKTIRQAILKEWENEEHSVSSLI